MQYNNSKKILERHTCPSDVTNVMFDHMLMRYSSHVTKTNVTNSN